METNLIGTLRTRKAQLTEALNASTDEKAYDQINAELASVTKALIIAENQEKARLAKEAADIRKAKEAARMALIEKIAKAKKEREKLDGELFSKIEAVYDAYSKAYDNSYQILEDIKALKLSAQELGVPEPESEKLLVCGLYNPIKSKEELLLDVINQYSMAHLNLVGARRRKEQGIPSKPELSWFSKGHGEFYPRPPEPPIPAKPQRPQV